MFLSWLVLGDSDNNTEIDYLPISEPEITVTASRNTTETSVVNPTTTMRLEAEPVVSIVPIPSSVELLFKPEHTTTYPHIKDKR